LTKCQARVEGDRAAFITIELRTVLRHAQKFSQNVGGLGYNLKMDKLKLESEISQLLKVVMATGKSESYALGYVLGSAYYLLDDTQKDELFQNVSRA